MPMFYKEYVLRVKRLQISALSDVVGSQVEKAANIRFAKFASCSSNLPGWDRDHDIPYDNVDCPSSP